VGFGCAVVEVVVARGGVEGDGVGVGGAGGVWVRGEGAVLGGFVT
jgi:hypothetical protein